MSAFLLMCVVLAATPPAEARDRGERSAPAPTEPARPPSDAEPTAEDILRALQRRPVNDVVPPGSAGGSDDWRRPKPQLWPDGFSWVDRTGRLQQEGNDWWFHFEPPGDGPPSMQLLPNSNLEVMVRMVGGSVAPIPFIVSGELTVFEGRNRLLVRFVARAAAPRPEPEPATAQPAARVRTDASAEDVLSKLQAQTPDAALLAPHDGPIHLPDGGSRALAGVLADGAPVVHRVGRLVREAAGWTFVSDAQRAEAAEPPMRLLPNLVLETMVRDVQRGAGGVVFTVSGEVTLYFGQNYLLPRMAIRRVDLGNLRP